MKTMCKKNCELKKEIELLRTVLREHCELCKEKDYCPYCRVTFVLKRHN